MGFARIVAVQHEKAFSFGHVVLIPEASTIICGNRVKLMIGVCRILRSLENRRAHKQRARSLADPSTMPT
jgi:hypothetical protein